MSQPVIYSTIAKLFTDNNNNPIWVKSRISELKNDETIHCLIQKYVYGKYTRFRTVTYSGTEGYVRRTIKLRASTIKNWRKVSESELKNIPKIPMRFQSIIASHVEYKKDDEENKGTNSLENIQLERDDIDTRENDWPADNQKRIDNLRIALIFPLHKAFPKYDQAKILSIIVDISNDHDNPKGIQRGITNQQ